MFSMSSRGATSNCELTLPMCATRDRYNRKQLRADGASRGASRGIADANLQVGGGENELGRLDSKQSTRKWYSIAV
jgi:hypothetical protein